MDDDAASSIYSRSPSGRIGESGVYSRSQSGRLTNPGNRRASYTPSYMSSIQSRTPVDPEDRLEPTSPLRRNPVLNPPRRKPLPANTSARHSVHLMTSTRTTTPPAMLFLAIPALPRPSILSFLETLLIRQSFAGIAILGSKENGAAIKQLKVDIYALIGKLKRELGIVAYLSEDWNEADMQRVVQEATKDGASGIQGVLYFPAFDAVESADSDILELTRDSLELCWKRNVNFLHVLYKCTIPKLLSRSKQSEAALDRIENLQAPFFLVEKDGPRSVASQITNSVCDTIINLLGGATQTQNLTIGYAEAFLVPKPEQSNGNTKTLPNEVSKLDTQPSTLAFDKEEVTPSESPTHLWNMWALQNDIGDLE